jgi:hypothetical protein
MSHFISRRSLFKGAAGIAGAAAAAKLLPQAAYAQTAEQSAVVVVHLNGGYNALFNSSDSFASQNLFGCTSSNIEQVGSSALFIDRPTFGTLPTNVKSKMATIGMYHRFSGHDSSPRAQWSNGARSYALMLASAMGGTAPVRCAVVGNTMPPGARPEENGISMQKIIDMSPLVAALGGTTTDTTVPDRAMGAGALKTARTLSANGLAQNPTSQRTTKEAYDTTIAMLETPPQGFDYASLAAAYGVTASTTRVSNFTTQMMAAELLILAGAKVIVAFDNGDWDTHEGSEPYTGIRQRNSMTNRIMPGLARFLPRVMAMTGRNVTLAITGDFARDLPGSNHANFTSTTVFGTRVMAGTTGRCGVTGTGYSLQADGGFSRYNGSLTIPSTTPGVAGFWAYLAALARVPTTPFGANPHNLVLP